MTEYGINEIESLSFTEGVRERIAMYLGSADMQGVYNAIQEIISNSIDEYYMGYGKKIEIELDGNKIKIRDYGRGVPFGIKDDGSNVLVDIYSRAHTGGKFNDKVYNSVAGLNGIGAKATCLSSANFMVSSYRDNKKATAIFKEGILQSYKEENSKELTGTLVVFEPDQKVYNLEPINIDFEILCQKCKNLSYLTKGLEFILKDIKTSKKVIYCAQNGLLDLIKDNVTNPIHKTPIYFEMEEGNLSVELALQWTKNKGEKWFVFTNGLQNVEGGTSLTGVKTAITTFMKKHFKGVLEGDSVRSGLVYAVSCKIPNPSFANQTKTKINNPELRGLSQRATGIALNNFSVKNSLEFKDVIDYLTKIKKAEAAAARAMQQVMDTVKEVEKSQKINDMDIKKLSEAEKLGEDAILLCVEGKSAASNIRKARDPKKYGLLQLRGKCINALSNPLEDVLANEEVKLLLKATGINVRNYKQSKLRYGRVGICVDADDDGRHIACLIIALFYVLAPEFLRENRLVWLHAPLYKVTKGGKRYYYYTEDELLNGVKGEQIHFKGLGEMDDLIDNKIMFDPETQRMEVLTWNEEIHEVIQNLMGKDSQPKKDFVFNRIDFEKFGEI